VSIADAARWSWLALRTNLLGFVLLAAVATILGFLQTSAAQPLNDRLVQCQATADPVEQLACLQAQGTSLVPVLAVSLGAVVLQLIASVGVYRASLAATEGTPPDFSMLINGRHLGTYIVLVLVWLLMFAVGFAFCILPGLLVLYWLQFAPYFVLDRGYGIGEAISSSFRLVTRHARQSLGLLAINIGGFLVGSLLLGLPNLVTLPFTLLLGAVLYRAFNAEAVR
jgi:uncharacterized membrane protein